MAISPSELAEIQKAARRMSEQAFLLLIERCGGTVRFKVGDIDKNTVGKGVFIKHLSEIGEMEFSVRPL